METISPSLSEGAPGQQSGLGLFLQPIADLPLACSPSPSEDDFGFLDMQLDLESAHVEVDEFLALLALRKHALAQERAARMIEADLNEPITAAVSVLLPPSPTRTSISPSTGNCSFKRQREDSAAAHGLSSTRASVSAVLGPKPLEKLVGLKVRSAVEVEAAILRRRLGTVGERGAVSGTDEVRWVVRGPGGR